MTNMKAIQTVTVGAGGASSISFTSIPQTYTDLILQISLRGTYADYYSPIEIAFNSNTSNFSSKIVGGNGSSTFTYSNQPRRVSVTSSTNATALTFGNGDIYIANYTSSAYKSICSISVLGNNVTDGNDNYFANLWSNTSAINSITLTPQFDNFAEYSTATLYGISNIIASGAKAYGGYITEDSTYFYHTFLASGTFTPTQSLSVDCLVVAGGGSGGADSGGGGGAGGFRTSTGLSVTATDYSVTVGGGGASPVNTGSLANSGSNSTFSTITSSGGGRGGDRGYAYPTGSAGGNGGSGGGGGGGEAPTGRTAGTGNSGSYSPSEGSNGGAGIGPAGNFAGGGGGGAGGAGTAATSPTNGGGGGIGSYTVISGGVVTNTGIFFGGNYYFAGGGGGGGNASAGTGGTGGGGAGGLDGTNGNDAIKNTGGGGGGAGNSTSVGRGGAGGSGLVIIRYAK